MDLLHRLREDRRLDFDESADALLEQYRGDHALVPPNAPPPALERAVSLLRGLQQRPFFREDALLMTRVAYPFGKNAVNKTLDPTERFALETSESHTIMNSGVSYQVSPAAADGVVTIALGNRNIRLRDGEAAILGRNLRKSELFGVQVNGVRGVSVPSRLPPPPQSEGGVSRAGLLVILKDGQLFVFDRGSKNSVEIISGKVVTVFNPEHVGADGTLGDSCSMSMEEYRRLKGDEQ
ncbi:MAG: hypothetical protein V1926_01845 [Candidatus Peregrinibacteria bacterium]